MNEPLNARNDEELSKALALAQHTVYKNYLTELSAYPVVQPPQILLDQTPGEYVRFFRLDELSCRKGEDIFQKLATVYHASMALGCHLFVMVDAKSNTAPVDIYLGLRRTDAGSKAQLNISFRALMGGLESNFPGTRERPVESQKASPKLLEEIFGENAKHVASVSCVASLRDKTKTEHKTFIQGLERFIDTMRGSTYTALFIAEPVLPGEQAVIRSGYEELYSALSPFRKGTWSYSENESKAVMESLTEGTSYSVTNGTTHTQGHTVSVGMSIGMSGGKTLSTAESITRTAPAKTARLGHLLTGAAGAAPPVLTLLGPMGVLTGGAAVLALGAAGAVGAVGGAMQGGSTARTITDTVSRTLNLFGSANAGYAKTTSDSESYAESRTDNMARTTGHTDTTGTGRTLQIENTNKSIEEMLKRIDEQLKRMQEGEDYGSYSCGAYFLSAKPESSIMAANTYRALMVGEGSSVESGAINTWNGIDDPERVAAIKEYLQRFVHPVFAMPVAEAPEDKDACQVIAYTPGTMVSGLELPLHLGLPTRSVYGLPVLEYAEFGRNVKSRSRREGGREAALGSIYHMGRTEKAPVSLDAEELTTHTFITGSTGAGKSNTIYGLISKLCFQGERPVHFLVVEPAKGEYKNIFGGCEGVSVYGTNPNKSPLLQLNPFSFPDDIHVLEHIDRLVEVFNACWPMYAAMPAVLKEAIEASYTGCGWDLTRSSCVPRRFPTFAAVLRKLPEIMDSSAYSKDTRGDYTGALVTRVKSLTNGIHGQIFCPEHEISDEELFDRNVIVDLSRVGSMETKALLMGILMIKLQEYRMAGANAPNAGLQHITVLEEAHNLLRRTSGEQSQENSNLQGKSVEMLANAIAEMRTYGEGFIIADQAPGLLDMAVIRNTNTKIIMRLPDEMDRDLVGRTAGLNDDQIAELARLDRGVAAVFRNHWLEPVLCMVDRFDGGLPFRYTPPEQAWNPDTEALFAGIAGTRDGSELSEECAGRLRDWIDRQDTGREVKELLHKALRPQSVLSEQEAGFVLYCLVKGKRLLRQTEQAGEPAAAQAIVEQAVAERLQVSSALAAHIRKMVFAYAASQVQADEARFRDLLYYGGVK